MALTAAQLKARDGRLTASRVGCLMTGDATKILTLWREMVGDAEPEDLSGIWPVRLGEDTEALNLEWYERRTGRTLMRRGEVVVCPGADWAACTLDGWDAAEPGPVDAKHVGGFEDRRTVVDRYVPQMMWQMICTGAKWSALSIIEGAREPAIEPVLYDAIYAGTLMNRAERFMECVWSLTPPVDFAPTPAPAKPEKVYDMTGSNAWAEHAGLWLENRMAAKAFDGAAKEIKALVAPDASRAYGHGISVSRSKAGALTIKQEG